MSGNFINKRKELQLVEFYCDELKQEEIKELKLLLEDYKTKGEKNET